MKSVQIRIFFWSVFPRIRIEYGQIVFSPNAGKHGPEKTPYLDTFHAANIFHKMIYTSISIKQEKSHFFFLKVISTKNHSKIFCTGSVFIILKGISCQIYRTQTDSRHRTKYVKELNSHPCKTGLHEICHLTSFLELKVSILSWISLLLAIYDVCLNCLQNSYLS